MFYFYTSHTCYTCSAISHVFLVYVSQIMVTSLCRVLFNCILSVLLLISKSGGDGSVTEFTLVALLQSSLFLNLAQAHSFNLVLSAAAALRTALSIQSYSLLLSDTSNMVSILHLMQIRKRLLPIHAVGCLCIYLCNFFWLVMMK